MPQRPHECGDDARRCADAGAVLAHWHAIDADGIPRLSDADLYGDALHVMNGCILAYPSYRVDVPPTVDARLGHCIDLRERHRMEIAPLDIATVNVFATDAAGRALGPGHLSADREVIANPPAFLFDALARYRDAGLVPTVAAFDVGSTRAIAALAATGVLAEPVLVKIFLWESPLIGPRPSVDALDLHLRQLPPGLDVEWLVVTYGMTDPAAVEVIGRAALERGGGVRIGVGDSPRAFPDASNAQLVDMVVRWAGDAGRPIAGLDAMRARLGTSRGEEGVLRASRRPDRGATP